jgi:hypothetical protein
MITPITVLTLCLAPAYTDSLVTSPYYLKCTEYVTLEQNNTQKKWAQPQDNTTTPAESDIEELPKKLHHMEFFHTPHPNTTR